MVRLNAVFGSNVLKEVNVEFGWSKDLAAFRDDVRHFAQEHLTPELQAELSETDEGYGRGRLARDIRQAIEERGWLKMCLPVELGGEGKSLWYQFILSEELSYWGIPFNLGTASMIGPAVERFGTEEQKQKYLPGLWSGEITCALGYSEPNAGTDLASLETRAVRDGDDWVINGQKMWTSGAHMSSHVWLAARTEPEAPKHRGISMFIVPLNTPGISVRPLRGMSGIRTNETFYEDVRVPGDALIGEVNRGWYIAANALDHERVTLAPFSPFAREYDRAVEHLKDVRPDLLREPRVRGRLAELKVDLHIQRALRTVNAAIIERGDTPTMQASMAKVWSSELRYRMNSTFMDLLGRSGTLSRESGDVAPLGGEIERTYRGSPVMRFGAGTNEVQRNIIAQRGLGLPRT
jgi:alkylation response protein AidB-like acyl-CoA dehydrogenase